MSKLKNDSSCNQEPCQKNKTLRPTYLRANIQTEGGARDVWTVLTEGSGSMQYARRKLAPLRGKPLPDLKTAGIELPADAAGRMLLVCLFDMAQRPSRNCVTQLVQRAESLKQKGVTIVAIQAGTTDTDTFATWSAQQGTAFLIGRIEGDSEKINASWGAQSLPWLILTDRKGIVAAEGFSLAELDKKIDEVSGR